MQRGAAVDVAEVDVSAGVEELADPCEVALAGEVHEPDVGVEIQHGRILRIIDDLRPQRLLAIGRSEGGLPAEEKSARGHGLHGRELDCWRRVDWGFDPI